MVQSQPRQIVHESLSQKNPIQKRAGGVAQGVGPEFKPQHCKKKKREKKRKSKMEDKIKEILHSDNHKEKNEYLSLQHARTLVHDLRIHGVEEKDKIQTYSMKS
jgi:hypothetical protein